MSAQFDSNSQQSGRQTVDPLTGNSYTRPSFADEVRGAGPKEIDLDLARLAQDVYRSDDRQRGEVAGWRALTDEEYRKVGIDPALRSNDASGFDAEIYTDGNGRYTLAYRGTDAGKDWGANLGQGLGFETAQYNQAIVLAKQARTAFGDELVITGHSLGGGLAAVGSAVADTPAVTFNAAGVNDRTLTRIGLDPGAFKQEAESGQVRRYAVDNEILTGLQERNLLTRHLMPDAVGHKIELPDPDPLTFWQNLNPVKSIKHGIEMHMMDSVIRSQEQFFGELKEKQGLMSHPDHPLNGKYQQTLDTIGPMLKRSNVDPDKIENVAGVLTMAAHKKGLEPDHAVVGGSGNIFVTQGPRSEHQPYAHANLLEAMRTPLAESSRQSLALFESAPQATVAQPAQTPQTPSPDQELQANPLRARL
jgi:hypothetical protein